MKNAFQVQILEIHVANSICVKGEENWHSVSDTQCSGILYQYTVSYGLLEPGLTDSQSLADSEM